MEKKDSLPVNPAQDHNIDLIKSLMVLNEIGSSINRLGMGHDLPATLRLVAEGAVRAVMAQADLAASDPNASAVIWIYDEARREFDMDSRVSAGEPERASIQDFPRPEGLGRQAVQRRRRLLSYEEKGLAIHPAKQAAGARFLVCYPLIVEDEIVGVLYVYRCDELPFSEIELLMLDNFVNLAAIAIHHGRQVGGLSRALARKVDELEKVGWASRLISSRSNLDETLQEILSIGLDMTAAQYGSFELYDKKQDLLTIKALAGRKEGIGEALPINQQSVVGWVAASRRSLLIPDLHQSPWRAIYHPLPADREMRSELAVPLIGAGGGLEGVLNIESPLPQAFTEDDRRLLEALATQAVIAMQEIRLLDAMHEIGEVLLKAEGDELFKLIIDRACDLVNVSVGLIWTISDDQTLVLRQSTGGYRKGEHLPLDNSLTGRSIKNRQVITIDNVQTHPGFLRNQLAVEQGWVSAIIVPMLIPGDDWRPLGSFSLYSTHLRDFSNWDKKLLTCLANHAAVAVQNAEQLDQLKQARERQAVAETFAAVGDVAANLLHQLNNKVGAISVRAQGIQDKCDELLASSPYLAAQLEEIEQNARQAMDIVSDSMAHLRPIQGQLVDVAACLGRALERAEPGPQIKIFQTGLENLPPARASEKQLEMVFFNLIDNALKAMAGQGELHLSGRWEQDEVAVTVADSGPGIPPEVQPHIFDFSPVVREVESESNRRLGFGLWWVKTFVERFGGRLLWQSEPDQGTAFTVYLPAKKDW